MKDEKENELSKIAPLCILHTQKFEELEAKINMLTNNDVVTVVNGQSRTIPVKDAIAEIWQQNHLVSDRLTAIEERTEVLQDFGTVVRIIKKYWKALLIIGVICIAGWYGGLGLIAKVISNLIIKTIGG